MQLPPTHPAMMALKQNAAPANATLSKAAEDFEASVLADLLQPMFAALDADGLGGGGSGEKMFRPMLVDHYARAIARTGGVGIARMLSEDIAKLQSAEVPAGAPHAPAR
jgi:peptidoglycan hydrolase FlgJ